MKSFNLALLSILAILSAGAAYSASFTFGVSPSLGVATIENISGYNNAALLRIDGSFYPLQPLGVNLFVTQYQDFESNGTGHDVTIALSGGGVGVTGRWPVHAHVQPYLRAEYFSWTATASGLGRTLGEEKGGSVGLAIGAQFPIKGFFGLKAEVSGYNDVSGANIRQFTGGATFEF